MPHIVHMTATNAVTDTRVFQKECISAVKEGYKVTLIVCHDRDETIDGVRIKALPRAKSRSSRMVGLTWKMYREAMRQDGDLYHLHHPDQIPAGLLLKLRGKKVVYDTHEAYRDKILSMEWIPALLRKPASRAFALYERLTSRAWDHIIVCDRHSSHYFPDRPLSRVPNYPLLESIEQSATAKKRIPRILIYEGAITEQRGLGLMLEIARLLSGRNVELHLVGWCSSPQDEERLHSENVRYLGMQSSATVYRLLSEADLGLLLLEPVPGYTYHGENSNKLFEYMWSGIPVVCSDFPNLRQIVEEAQCGICVDPRDPEAAAESIVKLLEQPELRLQMGTNGHNAVARVYNWPEASKVLMRVYATVLRCDGKAMASAAG